MIDLLRLIGVAGGGFGIVGAVIALLAVPEVCTQVNGLPIRYDCFGWGVLQPTEWALVLGGAAGGLVAIALALRGSMSNG